MSDGMVIIGLLAAPSVLLRDFDFNNLSFRASWCNVKGFNAQCIRLLGMIDRIGSNSAWSWLALVSIFKPPSNNGVCKFIPQISSDRMCTARFYSGQNDWLKKIHPTVHYIIQFYLGWSCLYWLNSDSVQSVRFRQNDLFWNCFLLQNLLIFCFAADHLLDKCRTRLVVLDLHRCPCLAAICARDNDADACDATEYILKRF